MVLPTIPISFLRTVRIKEGRRSTDLADTLDPNPITSNSHITDLHRLLTNLFHFFKISIFADYYPIIPKSTDITDSTSSYQSRRLLSHHSKVNRQIPIHITKNSETIYRAIHECESLVSCTGKLV